MKFLPTALEGVILVEPRVFPDDRGFFLETYHQQKYAEGGIPDLFVQDNHSYSVRGTLRGLHAQLRHPQGKLVRAVQGEIFDVAVDIRPDSPTFGKWVGERLSGENLLQLWIPAGPSEARPGLLGSGPRRRSSPARCPRRHRWGGSSHPARSGS